MINLFKHGWRKAGLLVSITAMVLSISGCGGGGSGGGTTTGPSLERGYADVLLSPVFGRNFPPSLGPGLPGFPATVAFIPAYQYSAAAERDARAGFEQWVSATNQRVKFNYVTTLNPINPNVVVQFVLRRDIDNFEGFTSPQGRFTLIQIAVDNPSSPATGFFQEQSRFIYISAHEMGHALGIGGHSPFRTDIMFVSPEKVEASVSRADVATLLVAYGGRL